MAKENIRNIVPEPVSVSEPKISEWHRKLSGSAAMSGSPKGREAKPTHVRQGFKMPGSK